MSAACLKRTHKRALCDRSYLRWEASRTTMCFPITTRITIADVRTASPIHTPPPSCTEMCMCLRRRLDVWLTQIEGGGYLLLSSALDGDACRCFYAGHLEELELLVSHAQEMLDGTEISSPDRFSLFSAKDAIRCGFVIPPRYWLHWSPSWYVTYLCRLD